MSTTTSRRRSTKTGDKAAQDKAQREAKAAEAAAKQDDEASAEELAAQQGRPSNEQEVTEEDLAKSNEAEEASDDDLPAIGALTTMSVNRGSSKASVWTDRLNEAADTLSAAGYPEGQGVAILHCATPKTAANTANGVRRKVKEGTLDGLAEGVTFQIVARGRVILATVTPVAKPESEGESEGEAADEQ